MRLLLTLLLLLTIFFHPHLKTLVLAESPTHPTPQSAEELWRAREFSAAGSFALMTTWPEGSLFITTFPDLATIPFVSATTFTSNSTQSVDLIVEASVTPIALATLGQTTSINSIAAFEKDGKQWTIGVFDQETAIRTNGYTPELDKKTLTWIHLSTISKAHQ
jgi:hypothetical protein